MNILIIHAHWNNRGDEAALRAMIDSLVDEFPEAKIKVLLNSSEIMQFPYQNNITAESVKYPRVRDIYTDTIPFFLSGGRVVFSSRGKHFKELVKEADIVIHGPGGPSIGDIYANAEFPYLYRLLIVKTLKTPYAFYAPSMGPFDRNVGKRNWIRRKILENAQIFCLREPISRQYVADLKCKSTPIVTLDSAFQYSVDREQMQKKLDEYIELNQFIQDHDKIVGITVTDLKWNPKYASMPELSNIISRSFTQMIQYLNSKGYAVLFIPQLFGMHNDKDYMLEFCSENCFVMDDTYDCYFQQYIISKMYALIGMRYHSNIFSAKMGSPFLSIAYEQKMTGFMEKIQLTKYCIDINELSFEILKNRFELLEQNYVEYKQYLEKEKEILKNEARKTTELVLMYLNKK